MPIPVVSMLLVILGVVMLLLQWRQWKEVQRTENDPEERDFAWRQFRRRSQMSVMLGLVGGALWGGELIVWLRNPSLFVFYWVGVVILTVWMGVLAVADMIALRIHIGRTLRERRVEHEQLTSELRRLQAKGSNGHSSSNHTNGTP